MTNVNDNKIEKKDYDLLGILDNESDAIEEFTKEFSSGYLCDVISEVSDSYTPIYDGDAWENASNISDYIEEAISDGLVSTGGNINLVSIFQAGYTLYFSQSLYNNIDAMIFNRVASKVDEYIATETKEINLDEIVSAIEDETSGLDNNNQFEDLDDVVAEIIYRIKQGEFALEIEE